MTYYLPFVSYDICDMWLFDIGPRNVVYPKEEHVFKKRLPAVTSASINRRTQDSRSGFKGVNRLKREGRR